MRLSILLLMAMHVLGCEPQSPTSGSYVFPTAVLGVSPRSEAAGTQVRALLSEFGKEHGLHRYRVAEDPRAPDDMRQTPYNLRNTDFNPSPPDLRQGIAVSLFEYNDGCWIVKLMERSEAWTPTSLQAFDDLAARLAKIPAASTTVLVRPKSLQNAAAQNSRDAETDFEREQYEGEFCVRMNAH